jgi:hypothetical protein
MKKIFYICHSLPNSMTSGSDFVAINMLKKLKKEYMIHAISIGSNYCSKVELLKIYKELKNEKIKFYEINKKNLFQNDKITPFNFFIKNYIKTNDVEKAKKFINTFRIKKKDIILSFGSSSISACKNIDCIKIALFEDLQDQVQIYRTILSFNKSNFLKKLLKLMILKFHFRGYSDWLKSISNNHQIKYTFSSFDLGHLKKKMNVKILPLPIKAPNNIKKKPIKKIFNISMFSTIITQDFKGVMLMYYHLLPKLKNENLLKKIKLNLIMRIPENLPTEIKNIIQDKNINVCRYSEKIIKETDLLFYPSKYPVGIRTKILFAFSKSWYVATSSVIKKCIPELSNLKNSLLSNNIDNLSDKIVDLIKNQKKYSYLKTNSFKILKRYSFERFSSTINADIDKNIKLYDK